MIDSTQGPSLKGGTRRGKTCKETPSWLTVSLVLKMSVSSHNFVIYIYFYFHCGMYCYLFICYIVQYAVRYCSMCHGYLLKCVHCQFLFNSKSSLALNIALWDRCRHHYDYYNDKTTFDSIEIIYFKIDTYCFKILWVRP